MLRLLWQSVTEVMPPAPTMTERDLPDLSGKVYVVTGATSGVGLELAKMLYAHGAVVYAGSRHDARFAAAAEYITGDAAGDRTLHGELRFLQMDLMDLDTVAAAAAKVRAETTRLDGVWYNAGIMGHATRTTTTQGFEVHWGTNVVGHYALHRELEALLVATAQLERGAPDSVRAVWLASDAALFAPAQGIHWADVNFGPGGAEASQMTKYAQSKAAAVLLAHAVATRHGAAGVAGVAVNPGHLVTEMQQHRPAWVRALGNVVSHAPRMGALSAAYAGFAGDAVRGNTHFGYVVPWGRPGVVRGDIEAGIAAQGTSERLVALIEAQLAAVRVDACPNRQRAPLFDVPAPAAPCP
ncbi:uncharacterized protein V1518DRAFT_449288 [Limtongia smithiae]|uniref:uncharacterized protein n=1 Tax=Limtongia smithiae TaxID=1125753 RepID=UPI0034CDF038